MRDPHEREFHAVPSLMHYYGARGVWVGQQVLEKNLLAAVPGTFRWMKTLVGNQTKLPRHVVGRSIDNFQAAGDFLRQILLAAGAHANCAEVEVAFTVPVEAFEQYQNWLDEVVQSAGVLRPRYLDEASAAALGYAAKIKAGAPFMTFDLGGGTLDVAIVRGDDTPDGQPRCRSLGKAGARGQRPLHQGQCRARRRRGPGRRTRLPQGQTLAHPTLAPQSFAPCRCLW